MERVNKVVPRVALVHPRCGGVQRDLERFFKKKSLFKRTFNFLALDSMSTMDPSGLSTLRKIKEAFEVYMYDLFAKRHKIRQTITNVYVKCIIKRLFELG